MTEFFDEATAVWLRVVTPERVQLETSARWVQVPTVEGLLGIWPQHTSLISAVIPGELEYETADGVQRLWVDGGILYIRHSQVVVLTGSHDYLAVPERGTSAWDRSAQELSEVLGAAIVGEEEAAQGDAQAGAS